MILRTINIYFSQHKQAVPSLDGESVFLQYVQKHSFFFFSFSNSVSLYIEVLLSLLPLPAIGIWAFLLFFFPALAVGLFLLVPQMQACVQHSELNPSAVSDADGQPSHTHVSDPSSLVQHWLHLLFNPFTETSDNPSSHSCSNSKASRGSH